NARTPKSSERKISLNRGSSLSRWCLLRFGIWHRNEFRFPPWLLHRKLKRFHDDRSQRFTDLHLCFLAPRFDSCVGCRYEKRRGPASGQERITRCTIESHRL